MLVALTRKQIVDYHNYVLEMDGGVPGEKEPGLIDFMVDKPFTAFFGEEQYPGLFMKAAVYLEGFATTQRFNDGNKRTGVMCALSFLDLNGFELTATWEELYEFSLRIAKENLPLRRVASWLRYNSHAIID